MAPQPDLSWGEDRDYLNDRILSRPHPSVRVQEERIDYMDQPYDEYRFRIMKDSPSYEQRRQLEYARLEVNKLAADLRMSNDMRVARRVVELLRGLRLSSEAYHMIRRELEHGYDRYRDEELHQHERVYNQQKELIQQIRNNIQEKQQGDFLEEAEMKL